METTIEKIIQKSVIKSYETNENVFDLILKDLESWYDRPAHDLIELRLKESKKVKGDHFELLCQLYLIHNSKMNLKNVWLLHEVPDEILKHLALKRKDYGIDIVCQTQKDTFFAVQAKYRKIGRKSKNIVTWKMLSTFYALCLKTGPWEKYIVMTNADYITHMGKKTQRDQSICIGTWKSTTKETWLQMTSSTKNIIEKKEIIVEKKIENQENSVEWIRQQRLAKLNIN